MSTVAAIPENYPDLDEPTRIVVWKKLMLCDLGFTSEQVELLVSVRNFDWHRAEYLLDKGMSHELVVNELT